jgi:copper chaperone CopZ
MSGDTTGGREVSLGVTGMTCMMCVKHVTKALENLPGVSRVEVTLAPPRALVRHDPAIASVEAMIEAIRKAGYDAHA